jgi:serine/threonine protein kinase/Tol biopolymer transport system component
MIGRTVGHYRVLERLGGGGMGIVYKAEDLTLRRFVALKFLPPELTSDSEAKERFLREARAASLLEHPNICTVHEVAEDGDGQFFIAMGYYEGETLRALLDRGALPVRDALRIGTQVVRGLGKAHAAGIIHRDIKPANVIVTSEGVAKILDFGLAKLTGGSHITQSKSTFGTLSYMAPEQLLGEPVGPPTDLWAAGVVMFEALTGQRPFRGEQAQAIAYSIVNEQPLSLLELQPDAPAELGRILKKLLRKDPAQRYQSAEELLSEFDPLRTSGPAIVRSPSQPVRRREGLLAGAKLGPYEIVEPIGSGGMGDVYRARDTRLGRVVAVKVLAPEFSEDAERKRRLQREAEAISALSHPNICTLFDVGEQEGIDFLVMEYVEGETLAGRLSRGALPLDDLLAIGMQIGDALGKAHQKGIVHRDLKPGNVMLTTSGVVKLVDFGLAKDMRAVVPPHAVSPPDTVLPSEGASIGTLAYMAPEQVEGCEADARSDIFAFGSILYEMATGRQAFEAATPAGLIAAILERNPPPIVARSRESAMPVASLRGLATVDQIVRRCLEKDPDRRWQSAFDAANELRRLSEALARGELAAGQDSRLPGARLWVALALCFAGAIVASVWYGNAGSLRRVITLAPASSAVPKFTRLTWEPGPQGRPAISPDGTTFVYTSKLSGNLDIYLRRVGGEMAINLTKDCAEDDDSPSFSPDGGSIVFRSSRDGGGLFIMGATGESVRRLTSFGDTPDWSPDGRSVVFFAGWGAPGQKRGIWVVDVASGRTRNVFAGFALRPTWSPSGNSIAFGTVAIAGLRPGIAVIPATGGTLTMLHEIPGTAASWPKWAGGWIWFTDDREGVPQLWRVPVDGITGRKTGAAEPVALTTTPAFWPSATPDGKHLLFGSGETRSNFSIHDVDPARGSAVGKARLILSDPRYFMECWPSPDGAWIATIAFEKSIKYVVLIRASDGAIRKIENDASNYEPFAWAPDGSKLYFNEFRADGARIWAIRPDGSGRESVEVGPLTGRVHGRALSGDGRTLYVAADREAGTQFVDLSVAPAERKLVPLPRLPDGAEFNFDSRCGVSPDGRWLLGHSMRDAARSARDVYVHDIARRSYVRVAWLPANAIALWLPDSRRILLVVDGRTSVLDRETGAIVPTGRLDEDPTASRMGTAALSRDGRSLFTWRSEPQSDIWMLDYGAAK